MDDPRPTIRCLIIRKHPDGECSVGKLGIVLTNGEREVLGGIVALEDAERCLRMGYAVFVDPADESALARWQQIHSSRQPWR